MNKISKKLRNSIIIRGEKDELLEFIKKIDEKGITMISVQFPDKMSTSFVNNNWNVSKHKVEDVVFFAKYKKDKYVLIFNSEKFKYKILNIAKELFLDADCRYVEGDDKRAVIVRKVFKDGYLVKTETSAEFNANKYSIAKCFA